MKPLIISLIIGVFLFSCKTRTNHVMIDEKYSSHQKSFDYTLNLKKDSTFLYTTGFSGSLVTKCKGKWTYIKRADSIRLYCETESALESLTNTYMSERVNSFKIMKKGKVLRNKKIILKSK